MPWLEVPDWRSWESYAASMSDITPEDHTDISIEADPAVIADSEVNAEPTVITGTLNIVLPDDFFTQAPVAFPDDQLPALEPEPEPEPEPGLVGPEPERLPPLIRNTISDAQPQAAPTVADPEAYAAKLTLSRSERKRLGL